MTNQQIGDDVYSAIYDEYTSQTSENPAPNPQESTSSSISSSIRKAVEGSFLDAGAAAVAGALGAAQYSALVDKAGWMQASSMSSQAANFMNGLAGKMADAISQSGRVASAQEAAILNNLNRADAYMREANALSNKAASAGLAASEYKAIGQKLGAAASLYGLAMNAVAGDVHATGSSGASILGALLQLLPLRGSLLPQ